MKKLNARWDSDLSAYVVPDIVKDVAQNLKEKWEGELITVQITSSECLSAWTQPIYFAGYKIAEAYGRDSGAKLGKCVSQISGEIGSAGSAKNWLTVIEKGSIFRLQMLRSMLSKAQKTDKWEVVEITDNFKLDVDIDEDDEI